MVKTRPVLVGGLGLVAGVGLLEAVTHTAPGLGGFGLSGLLALSAGAWWLRSRSIAPLDLTVPAPRLTRAMVEAQIDRAALTLADLAQDLQSQNQSAATQSAVLQPLQQRLDGLRQDLDRRTLRIAIVGGQAVGKSALAQALAEVWTGLSDRSLQLIDTAPLFAAPPSGKALAKADALPWTISQAALDADWLLFVAAGDLTAQDLDCLTWLKARTSRLLVVLNKLDHYNPDAQAALLAQVQLRLRDLLPIESVVPIAAAPSAIQIAPQIAAEGTSLPNSQAIVPGSRNPAIGPLLQQLSQGLTDSTLHWETSRHSADQLQDYAKTLLNQLRSRQAIVIIDQYQWIAGGAAFLNPVPSLDLLATLAVNSQMILDLGKLHRQSFSLDQAKTVAGALAEMVVKLGFVELSTQALTTILKTNHVTYLAGGAVQGVSAAHLTRMVGLSLTDYFQSLDPMVPNQPIVLDQLRESVQKIFTANQQAPMLQGFAQQALKTLKIPMRQPMEQVMRQVMLQPVQDPEASKSSLESSQIL
jgi:uncharacterized protein